MSENITKDQVPVVTNEKEPVRMEASLLNQCESAYRRGTKAYALGLLLSGKHAAAYVRVRMLGGAERKGAVGAIKGRLNEHSEKDVDVNKLIGAWEAYALLSGDTEGKGLAKGKITYGAIRDGWRQLVSRASTGERTEAWHLPAGVEDACRAAWSTSVVENWKLARIQSEVAGLLAKAQEVASNLAKVAAEQAATEQAAAAAAATAADAEAKAQESALENAKAALLTAADPAGAGEIENADLTARLQKGVEEAAASAEAAKRRRAEMEFAQEQAAREAARRKDEERNAARLETEAKARAAVKAAAVVPETAKPAKGKGSKATKSETPAKAGVSSPEPTTTARPAAAPEAPVDMLKRLAKVSGSRDFAETLAQVIHGTEDPLNVLGYLARALLQGVPAWGPDYTPDDVVKGMLLYWEGSANLTDTAKRAVTAAVDVFEASEPAGSEATDPEAEEATAPAAA